jgi:hypothetical protein
MKYKVIGDFEEVKVILNYSYNDILIDYQGMLDYFGNKDQDVLLYGFILDNYTRLHFWYPPSYFLQDFYKKES